MRRFSLPLGVLMSLFFVAAPVHQARAQGSDAAAAKPGRNPNQPIDEEYTKKIREYTTEPPSKRQCH